MASAALLLAGCAAPGGGLPSSPHKATLELDGQSYTFAPTTCETGEGTPKISGPGIDPSDDTSLFLDIDIPEVDGWPAGKAFVYFGAEGDAPTDSYLVGEIGGGDDYSMGNMRDGYEIEAFFRNHDGADTGTGTFLINCKE